jgi:hypothetical protein
LEFAIYCHYDRSGWWFQPTPSEKYEFVSWDYYSIYYGKIKNCSKPATKYSWNFEWDDGIISSIRNSCNHELIGSEDVPKEIFTSNL